jgi:hypothetical protein
MPQDLHDFEQRAVEVGAVLLLLDPLMSRISDRLDTHRDAEVRSKPVMVILLGREGCCGRGELGIDS